VTAKQYLAPQFHWEGFTFYVGFVLTAHKNRAEVRRERKSEITSAPLNASLRNVKRLYKLYYFLPKNVRIRLLYLLGFYYTFQIMTSIISDLLGNLPRFSLDSWLKISHNYPKYIDLKQIFAFFLKKKIRKEHEYEEHKVRNSTNPNRISAGIK